ncbi:sulfotransferase domain-containing protein [Reichenbachiella sp.]|uniref:sulfotransferase domain-containing protein n=1 Tax=Reichenbachiella sp. TaxID=2184521 RepID=UPI003B5B7B07
MDKNYWNTQKILKRKWLLEKIPFGQTTDFQRFVILCHPRTGSTWLHTLLNSNPHIISFGEILNERKISIGLEHAIWNSHHSAIQSVGCKIFYEQLYKDQYIHVFEEIVSNKDIKVIDLSRTDRKATFSSLLVAQESDAWSSTQTKNSHKEHVTIEEKEFNLYVEKSNSNRDNVLQALHQHQVFSLSYEDLVRDQNAKLESIQKFLNTTPVQLFSLLQKQAK